MEKIINRLQVHLNEPVEIPSYLHVQNLKVELECSESFLYKSGTILIEGPGNRSGKIPFQIKNTKEFHNWELHTPDLDWIVKTIKVVLDTKIDLPISISVFDDTSH